MASALGISALSVRLLLLALLSLTPTGAGPDYYTWRECKQWNHNNRTSVDVTNCHITEIRRGDLDGLPNIKRILLIGNDIAFVDLAALRSTPELRTLTLRCNKLREVPVFDKPSFCPNLAGLSLSSNQFIVIQHAKTFSACIKLQELYLDDNDIEHIHPDVFKPLTGLKVLYLHKNKIAYIPETMFVNNNKLRELKLDDNRISQLPLGFVSQLSEAGAGVQYFHFHNNPWHCACLLELLADLKRVDMRGYYTSGPGGTRPECVYLGAYPCSRHAPSGLLRALPRAPASSSNSP